MSFGHWGLHTAGSDYSYGDGFRRYEKARNAGEKPHLYHAIANEWQPGNSILSPNLRFDGDHDQMLDLFHRNWGDQNEPSHESFYFVHLTPHLNEAHHIAEDTGRTRVLEIDPDKLSNTVNLGDEGYPAVYDEVNPEAIVGIHPAKHLHNNPDPYVRHVDGCDGLGDSCCGRAPSPHTASTNGIRYAHVVEADVDEDLHRLGMAQDEWAPNYVEHPASKPEDDGKVTLYHRTQPDRADAILKNQRLHPGDYWSSLLPPGEATPEDYEDDPVWFATSPEGRYPHFADTYGSAVLKVRVPADKIHWADGRRAQPGEVLHAAVYPRHLKGLPIERHAATRLAMPAPVPEGITFHHHPTNHTIPTEPWAGSPESMIMVQKFSAPAVEARHNGKTVGYLEWNPALKSTEVNGIQYGEHPPEVAMIKVHKDYRRHGVGTALFDFARQHQGDLEHSDSRTELGNKWIGYEQSRTAGRNGDTPPLTFEPFNTMWSNGIMARHAEDGRPVGHLHWTPRGEIDSITVHPELQRRGVGSAMLSHARAHPDQYPSTYPVFHSQHLTTAGRAWAAKDGHHLPDEQVYKEDDDPKNWGFTAVDDYVPLSHGYSGQNEEEMSRYLDQEWTPPNRTASTAGDGWPVWWRGRQRPGVEWDDRWSPNHREHTPGPWTSL